MRRALAGNTFSAVNETRGAFFDRSFQPILDNAGTVRGVIGLSVDVTSSIGAERRVRESERLLRSVTDALPHFVFMKDRDLDRWIAELAAEVEVPEDVTLELDTTSKATVRIDVERLRQAVDNLIQNAFQALAEFMPEAGSKRVTIATRIEDGRPSIRVRDTGPGVSADALAKIFEPLYSTRAFGVGLGLALVRSIAHQHGGEVEHLDDGIHGCTFRLWLPFAAGQPLTVE